MSELREAPYCEARKRLSYDEIVNILSIIAIRQDNIERKQEIFEAIMLEFIQDLRIFEEFQTTQMLEAKLQNLERDKKTPSKQLVEIENKLKDFADTISGVVAWQNLSKSNKYPNKEDLSYNYLYDHIKDVSEG